MTKETDITEIDRFKLAEQIAKGIHGRKLGAVEPGARTEILLVCDWLAEQAPFQVTKAQTANTNTHVDKHPLQHRIEQGTAEIVSSDRFDRKQVLLENVKESPLAWHYHRKGISTRQYTSGKRLYESYVRSGASGPGCRPLEADRVDTSTRIGTTDQQAEAAEQVRRALQAVGIRLSPYLVSFCLLEEGLTQIGKQKRKHPKGVRELVILALDLLADHYGE